MNNNSILYFLPGRYFNEEEFFITKNLLEKNNYISFTASDTRDMCEGTNGKKFKPDLRLENINANNFAGFVLLTGQFVKKLGDGKGNITSDVYNTSGGIFTKQVHATMNVEGDTNQSVAEYEIDRGGQLHGFARNGERR